MDKLKLIEAIVDADCSRGITTDDRLGKQIAILERGWIVVGDVEKRGCYMHICDAAVIRRWGTTKGLGEIAANGPTKETVLDPIPDLRVHELRVVALVEVKRWK